jgi:hypothetical protein
MSRPRRGSRSNIVGGASGWTVGDKTGDDGARILVRAGFGA